MPAPETTTRVTILGEEFQVRGREEALIQRLAGLVDEKFRAMSAARPSMDLKRLAVMVCLNMAEELHEERTSRESTIEEAMERVRRCRRILEEAARDDVQARGPG